MSLDNSDPDHIIFLKLAIVRISFSILGLGSLLGNWQFTSWQSQSLVGALLYFTLYWLTVTMGLCCVFGIKTRRTLPAFTWLLVGLQLVGPFWFLKNHFMHAQVFVAFGLMIINISTCDYFLAFSRAPLTPQNLPEARVAVTWFQFYILCFYVLAALAKCQPEFLSGVSLEANLLNYSFGSLPLPFEPSAWMYKVLALGSIAMELLIPLFLWWPKTRAQTVPVVMIFHLILLFCLHPPWLSFAPPFAMVMFIENRRFAAWLGLPLQPLRILHHEVSNSLIDPAAYTDHCRNAESLRDGILIPTPTNDGRMTNNQL
jgi:hypothetical protein